MSSKYGGLSKAQFYRQLKKYKSEWAISKGSIANQYIITVPDKDNDIFESNYAEVEQERLDNHNVEFELEGENEEEEITGVDLTDEEDANEEDTNEDDYDAFYSNQFTDANEEALDELRFIVFKGRLTSSVTKLILDFLTTHTDLVVPKRYSTLMRTPRNHSVLPIPVGLYGDYIHFGIQNYFTHSKYVNKINFLPSISLKIGIDGIQIFTSSKLTGWPIIGQIHELPEVPPFLIGIYVGNKKPSSFDEFLTPFCNEFDISRRESL